MTALEVTVPLPYAAGPLPPSFPPPPPTDQARKQMGIACRTFRIAHGDHKEKGKDQRHNLLHFEIKQGTLDALCTVIGIVYGTACLMRGSSKGMGASGLDELGLSC